MIGYDTKQKASGRTWTLRSYFYTETSVETKCSATAEIARVGGRYAVQGHSRSLMLVPTESLHATSYY